jgi:hypothetical protein
MAPDTDADPSQPPATHLSASHIKSNQMNASQHTACYRSRTTPCASDSQTTRTQPDSPRVPHAVIATHKPATRRRSRKSQHDDMPVTPYTCRQALGTQQQQQLQQQQQQSRHSVGRWRPPRRDDTARADRRVMRQHHRLLKRPRIATAAARLLQLVAAARPMKRSATHSNTAE